MSQEALCSLAEQIGAALEECCISALVEVILGDGKLYGTATILSDDLNDGVSALRLIEGVTVRRLHPMLGLVTFDYVPNQFEI
jgi:hypothetical protein